MNHEQTGGFFTIVGKPPLYENFTKQADRCAQSLEDLGASDGVATEPCADPFVSRAAMRQEDKAEKGHLNY